jgi:hypothetical protein
MMGFKERFYEKYVPIMRLVNDAKKILKEKYPNGKFKYEKLTDYDLSGEKIEKIPCEHDGHEDYAIFLVKRKNGGFFDVLPKNTKL